MSICREVYRESLVLTLVSGFHFLVSRFWALFARNRPSHGSQSSKKHLNVPHPKRGVEVSPVFFSVRQEAAEEVGAECGIHQHDVGQTLGTGSFFFSSFFRRGRGEKPNSAQMGAFFPFKFCKPREWAGAPVRHEAGWFSPFASGENRMVASAEGPQGGA